MSPKKPRNVLRECLQLLGKVFHPAKASQTHTPFPFWGPSTWQRCLESSTTTCLNQKLAKIMFLGWSRSWPSATDCKVRLYHFVRETTENLSGKKIRKKLSKISYKQRMNMGKYQTGSIRNYQTFQKPITNNSWSVLYLQAYRQGTFPINCTS